tara:strand:- start:1077 stop:1217 length:141 start_codon:yes stop_codon:yes gene_type:complete
MDKELVDLWKAVEGLSNSLQNITSALETITEFNKTVVQKLTELESR